MSRSLLKTSTNSNQKIKENPTEHEQDVAFRSLASVPAPSTRLLQHTIIPARRTQQQRQHERQKRRKNYLSAPLKQKLLHKRRSPVASVEKIISTRRVVQSAPLSQKGRSQRSSVYIAKNRNCVAKTGVEWARISELA